MERILWTLRQFEPDRKTFEIIAVIMVVVTAILIYGFKGESQTVFVDKEGGTGTGINSEEESASSPTKGDIIYVDVDGAVKHPGVYEMAPGARVFQAVEKAGGLKKHADTSNINLAEKVKDGQKINVPSKKAQSGESAAGSGASSVSGTSGTGAVGGAGTDALSGGGRININSASSEELQQINGIGPATAQKIIDYRNANGPFKNTEELKNVSGIGDKTYEKMKDVVGV